jgi:hypothetical protein
MELDAESEVDQGKSKLFGEKGGDEFKTALLKAQ